MNRVSRVAEELQSICEAEGTEDTSLYSLLPKHVCTLLIALPLSEPLWEAINIDTNKQGEFYSKGRKVQQFLTRLRTHTVLAPGSSPEPLRGLARLTRAEAARQPTVTRSWGLDKLFFLWPQTRTLFLMQFPSCDFTAPRIYCVQMHPQAFSITHK